MIGSETSFRLGYLMAILGLLLTWPLRTAEAVIFPGLAPGEATARIDGTTIVLENNVLSTTWDMATGRTELQSVTDKASSRAISLSKTECFEIVLGGSSDDGPTVLKASDLVLVGEPRLAELTPNAQSPRLSERSGGLQVVVDLASADGRLRVRWQGSLRDGSHYVRQSLHLKTKKEPVNVVEIAMWDMVVPGAKVVGSVDGSPVVAGNLFFAVEHPMSKSHLADGESETSAKRFRCSLPCQNVAGPERRLVCSSVVGVVPEGQLRRGFLCYLERERAQPYRPLLHYNNGSEIGCEYWQRRGHGEPGEAEQFRKKQESIWLENIHTFGRELVEKRKAVLDMFGHDFEWDDETLVWKFHSGYPNGFAPARQAAQRYRASVGVWLSPSGGYPGKRARIDSGRAQGFETNPRGLALAGPKYYARVRDACANMVNRYGVSYFKFDGFAAGNNQPGAGKFGAEADALLRLIAELRELKPDVFINPSTGSWLSPFWLLHADSVWRQGSDTGVAGEGSIRQQWITYRDGQTYKNVVCAAPLYPISSLMIHGIYINHLPLAGNPYDPATPRPTYEIKDIRDEIRSFFGTGTNLQELYIAPDLMTAEIWDALAEAANWSRRNSDIMADTHWVGGDPSKGEVYGWASWSHYKAVLVLRNPRNQPATINLDVAEAFDLPAGGERKYVLKPAWKEDTARPTIDVSAGRGQTFQLAPFEILVFDAEPKG